MPFDRVSDIAYSNEVFHVPSSHVNRLWKSLHVEETGENLAEKINTGHRNITKLNLFSKYKLANMGNFTNLKALYLDGNK